MDAELVDEIRDDEIVELIVDEVLAAPVAEDVPGDLRRTLDEEGQAPDVRVVVAEYRRREEDGAPLKREAPEPKDLRARFPVVRPPTAVRADPGDHGPQHLEAIAGGQGPCTVSDTGQVSLHFRPTQKPFCGIDSCAGLSMIQRNYSLQRRQSSQEYECDPHAST